MRVARPSGGIGSIWAYQHDVRDGNVSTDEGPPPRDSVTSEVDPGRQDCEQAERRPDQAADQIIHDCSDLSGRPKTSQAAPAAPVRNKIMSIRGYRSTGEALW